MQPPGRAAIAAAKSSGVWGASAEVDALFVPDDLDRALGPNRDAFDAFAPSYRRNVLRWLSTAKRAETRAKRIAQLDDTTARSEKIPNY